MNSPVFDEIIGQDRALEPVRRALQGDRLHHSLLFHGVEGVGKRRSAFALAAAIQCSEAPGAGCGQCAVCRRVLQGYEQRQLKDRAQVRAPAFHADVLFYPPRRKQIQIDQIQDLCREAAYRPYEGKRRIFIVDPADRMNREAANALLKTLEEPPPSAILILITAHPQALLPTLRSRCRDVRFAPLAIPDLARILEQRDHPPAEAWRLARLAGGSVGTALSIDLEQHDRIREDLVTMLEAAGSGGGLGSALGLAERLGADAATLAGAMNILASLLRDLALLQHGVDPAELVHADLVPRLKPLVPRFATRAPAETERLAEAARRVQGNVNPRLAAEAVLVRLVSSPSS